MKKFKFSLAIGIIICILPTYAQTPWFLTGNNPSTTNFLGTTNTQPLRIQTQSAFRMKINPNISYQVNLLGTQPKNGFTLIGPNTSNGSGTGSLYDNSWGAFSLLHLNGDGQFVEEWGYRNWMRTGITFTGNRDLAYMGLRKLSTNEQEEDMTETTIAWTDNNGSNGFSSDDLQFRFITGRSGGVDNLATPDDLDGLHIARFTSNGRIGFGNTFGLNATGMTPTVPYVAPQNLLHMSLSGNQPVFLQITNRDNAGGSSGTGETANDGLYLGLPATTANNMPGIFSNRENDRLLFRTNEANNFSTGERMRVMHIGALNDGVGFNPGNLPNNLTRIGISHNPDNPVTRPLSLLHLGYNTQAAIPNENGWRPWMDVGMYVSQQSDNVYIGLKDEGNDRQDAVVSWGDNQVNAGPAGAGPDNFRFIFTSTPFVGAGGTVPATGANGLEGLRISPTQNNGLRTGIGGDPTANLYNGGSQNPTATLEVNAWGGGVNNSGLRFTNLTSAATPTANPGAGVLSVNGNGDVVYVESNTATPAIGNYCPDPQMPLADHFEVPLNGFSYSFTAEPDPSASNVNIGNVTCGLQLPARLLVYQTESMPDTSQSIAIAGVIDGNHLNQKYQYGIYGIANTMRTYEHAGVFGVSYNPINGNGGPWLSRGIGIKGEAGGGDENVGVFGDCVGNTNQKYNYGIYGRASGATVQNYAGFFLGDVLISGTGWVNGNQVITSDRNLKTGITPISNSTSILKQLLPSTYYMDTVKNIGLGLSNRRQYGLIAQDLEKVLPDLVHETQVAERRDSAGNIVARETKYKGIDYIGLIPFLIGAIQEQQGEMGIKDSVINSLNERLSKLENCINGLNLCNRTNYRVIPNTPNTEENETNTTSNSVKLSDPQSIVLNQNVPNPFAENTKISFFLPKSVNSAKIIFHNQEGKLINSVTITERGNATLNVYADDLSSGIYTYTLIADDKVIDTKKMVKN